MATHSSVLAWSIPGTEEPGGLPSAGSHRVGHNGSDLARPRLSASKMAASGRRRLELTALFARLQHFPTVGLRD